MKYYLTFTNGVVYSSPDLFSKDPGWSSEENGTLGGIRQIRVPVTSSKSIILTGFEKYNFFVEVSQNIGGGGRAKIERFYFCGASKGTVLSYIINPNDRTIIKQVSKEGQEYCGTATRGWRQGIINGSPKEGICSH